MLTETQISEAFPSQWDLVIQQLEESQELSSNVTKAVDQFFSQLGAPQDHVEMMMAMLFSCPTATQKDIIHYVAANNQEKILDSMLGHLREQQLEVKDSADVFGWVQYFFVIALVSQITKIVEKMKEIN